MVSLTVLYPKSESSHFDHAYYINKHIPLVRERFTSMGLLDVRLVRGTTTLDGSAAQFELIGLLRFTSEAELSAALAAHGGEVVADVPNFTNIQPVIQISEEI
jgi:uncharacterized protein (TIGR02118 family)